MTTQPIHLFHEMYGASMLFLLGHNFGRKQGAMVPTSCMFACLQTPMNKFVAEKGNSKPVGSAHGAKIVVQNN